MPTFTFTSPDGQDYDVDGPEGATQEQAFQVLQMQLKTGQAGDFGASKENTVGRAIGENLRGVITAAGDIGASAPGMVGAAIPAAVEGIAHGPEAGIKEFGDVSEAMNPLSTRFLGGHPLPGVSALEPDRESTAYKAIMKPFAMVPQGYGNIAGGLASVLGASDATAGTIGATGELATDIGFGIEGMRGAIKGSRKLAKAKADRVAAEKAQSDAKAILDKRQADEAKQAAYKQAYEAMDGPLYRQDAEGNPLTLDPNSPDTMLRYPQNYQAPQLGLGGKVARIPDQVGKRTPTGLSQADWDQAMMAHEKEMKDWEAQQEEQYRNMPYQAPEPLAQVPTNPNPHVPSTGPDLQVGPPTAADLAARRAMPQGNDLVRGQGPLANAMNLDATTLGANGYSYQGGINYEPVADKLPRLPQEAPKFPVDKVRDSGGTELPNTDKNSGFNMELFNAQNEGKGVKEQLQAVASGEHPGHAALADHFLKTTDADVLSKEIGVGTKLEHTPSFQLNDGRDAIASYTQSADTIRIGQKAVGDSGTLLHEFSHAKTATVIDKVLNNRSGYEWAKPYVTRLQNLMNVVEKHLEVNGKTLLQKGYIKSLKPYGMTHLHEFVAETWGNPNFRKLLRGIKSPYGGTVYSKFIESVRKILRLPTEYKSVLEDVLHTSDEMMSRTSNAQRRAYFNETSREMMGELAQENSTKYSFGEFVKDMEAKGHRLAPEVLKGIYDKVMKANTVAKPDSGLPIEKKLNVIEKVGNGLRDIRKQYMDNRSFPEVKAEVLSQPDIGVIRANATGKITNSRFTAKYNPLISWASSQVHMIKNLHEMKANSKVHGLSRKNPSPGTYMHMWKQLTKDERVEVNQVGQALNNLQGWVGREGIQRAAKAALGKELTEKQLRAYLDRIKINQEVLSDLNRELVKNDREPIHSLPHYWSPADFDGPFIASFKNKAGDSFVKSFYLKPDEAKLKAAFPEYDVQIKEKGLRSDYNWREYETMLSQLRANQKFDAATAIEQQLRARGFARHGLKREGAKGAAGTEGGRKGLRRYEEVSERYIRQAYDYLGNRKIDEIHGQIWKDTELDARPNAKGFALDSLDIARGGGNEMWNKVSIALSDLVRGVVRVGTAGKVQLPQVFLNDFFKYSNRIATAQLLGFGNLTYIANNIMQPVFAFPKMFAMASENGGLGLIRSPIAVIKASIKAMNSMRDWNHPDIKALDRIGALDATFRYDASAYRQNTVKDIKDTIAEHASGTSLMGFIERNAVRRPAGLLFLEMIRELGIDKGMKGDEPYFLAKELTDHYMVSMKWFEKAHIFSRTGILGTVIGPLQSFSTTWLGMLGEYKDLALKGHINPANVLPLATFMGISLVTAGLIGQIGEQEYDALINYLNKHYHTNWPTMTQLIMEHAKSRAWRYGLLSDATGYNIGATMNAPTVTGSSAPGLQLMGNAVNFGANRLANTGMFGQLNIPTAVENREAVKGMMPRFSPIPGMSKGSVEEQYTPPGAPYQRANGAGGPYTRTDADWLARKLGTYTINEVEAKTSSYLAESNAKNRQARLTAGMSQIADAIMMSDDPNQVVISVMKNLREDGYKDRELRKAMYGALRSKLIESTTREMGHGTSSKQALIVNILKRLEEDNANK